MTVRTALAILALSVSLHASAGKKLLEPAVVDDALAYAAADRTKSLVLLRAAIAGAPDEEQQVISLHIAEQLRLLDDSTGATEAFQALITQVKQGPVAAAARLGLALLEAQQTLDLSTVTGLMNIDGKDGLDSQNADRFLLLAMHAQRTNDTVRMRDHAKRSRSFARREPSVAPRINAALDALDQGDEPKSTGIVSVLDKAEQALAEGDKNKARSLAQQVLDGSPSDDDALVASYLLRRLDAVAVRPSAIGLLLPLSGKYQAVGKQVQAAFNLGFKGAHGNARFEVADAGDSAESAIKALERLVLEQGVVAVVGPLRTPLADEVVRHANALRVPIVGLHQAVHTTDERPWAFQGMVNPDQQAKALVEYVTNVRGMKDFAIFAPDTPYGHTSADAFTAAVQAHGGSIKASVYYDNKATDLIPFAKELGRKDYEARAEEFRRLRAETRERGGNASRTVLPPVLDYDAIFLPDNARRIPIACAGLAYEEFPVGEFQTVRDGRTIPLLGLSGWNQHLVVTNGGPYVRGSVFTDIYLPSDPGSQAFAIDFKIATGRVPSALEVVANDTGAMLAAATKASPSTRAAFRDTLVGVEVDGLISGVSGFNDTSRLAEHAVKLLTLDKDHIYELLPPGEGADPGEPE